MAVAGNQRGLPEHERNSSEDEKIDQHEDKIRQQSFSSQREVAEFERKKANALLANPLREFTSTQLKEMGRLYALKHNLADPEDVRAFEIGAVIAKSPEAWLSVEELRPEEINYLDREVKSRWSQPKLLYLVIVLCSTCAAVQGADETVVNGAQLFYTRQFGVGGDDQRSTWLTGLLNSAPYFACAFVGCWLTTPMNNHFGRRGTIFLTCMFSALACLWQGFTNTWWSMFLARFALGLGIGPKSATVPIYAAETSPAAIRGALVMQWQMWTAAGIFLGYAADLALYKVNGSIPGLNWRLMMASAMIPALVVIIFVFLVPESPRWYLSKEQPARAYYSMCKLRYCKVQAARDLFYMHKGIEAESHIRIGQNKLKELITVPRNRRAMIASELVMFGQQFCGVNVIAYYSSSIFVEGGFSEISALSASLGFGLINFLFAIPAIYTIDTFGRRNLLLTTFPLMAAFLLFTGFSFWISNDKARLSCISLGIYLYAMAYSPGNGPVPFTYSAEAYPLYIRTVGMSLATATLWFFNGVLSITWPSLEKAFKPQGAFGFYAAWNVILWFGALLILPETSKRSLEELDATFSVKTREQAAHGLKQVPWFIRRYILRQEIPDLQPLVDFDAARLATADDVINDD